MNHSYIFAVLSFERFFALSMSLGRSVWLAGFPRHKQNMMGAKEKKFTELLLDFHRPFSFLLPNINRHNCYGSRHTPFSLALKRFLYISFPSPFYWLPICNPHLCPYHPYTNNGYTLQANYISSAGLACLEFHFLELNKISLKIFAVTRSN